MKNQGNDLLIHRNFLTKIIISLFYCWEKVLIVMNIYMIDKNSMKHDYLKNNIITVT